MHSFQPEQVHTYFWVCHFGSHFEPQTKLHNDQPNQNPLQNELPQGHPHKASPSGVLLGVVEGGFGDHVHDGE